MDQTFHLSLPTLLQIVQSVGILFLTLILAVLYSYRRRSFLLLWTLAWLVDGVYHLLSGLTNFHPPHDSDTIPMVTQSDFVLPVLLCGWLHVSLWVIGLALLRPGSQARIGQERLTARLVLVVLASVGPLVWLAHQWLLPVEQTVLLEAARLLGFSLGGILIFRMWWQTRQLASLLLATVLLLDAANNLYSLILDLSILTGNPFTSNLVVFQHFAEFVLEGLLAIVLVYFLLDQEQRDLREASLRLADSEERFRLIFEYSGVGIILMTGDGKVLQANPALLRLLGYTSDEMSGRRLSELVYEQDVTREVHTLASTKDDAASLYEREKRYVRKDGASIWARVLRVPIRDSQGAVRHHVGVLVDITERKLAEQALAASEQRYRLLNEVAQDGIFVLDEQGALLDANPAFGRMIGRTHKELLTQLLEGVGLDPDALRKHHQQVLQYSGARLETKLRHSDGSAVEVELSGSRLNLEGRSFHHGICRDVTDRKRAEEALRETQLRLREERDFSKQILETADVLIFAADLSGRILRFNATCADVLGWKEDEVRGKIYWDLFLTGRQAEATRTLHQELVHSRPTPVRTFHQSAHGVPHESVAESSWHSRSGEERIIAWRHSVVRDAEGQVRFLIGTGIDVTEQRFLEEKLRQARKMETLGTLVGGIAHDFNNQLTAVLGRIGMVLERLNQYEGAELRPNHKSVIDSLIQSQIAAQRCADITQRLQTFSSGKIGNMKPLVVASLFRDLERTLRLQVPPTVRLNIERSSSCWPIQGDSAQLQQALTNLISNACDAMPQGGTLTLAAQNLTISEVQAPRHPDAVPGLFVEFLVRDTGQGMEAGIQARLFEPFFTTKELGKGAGMGLAMVYGIVKAHKGCIEVDSTPGAGSSFRLYLPAINNHPPSAPAEPVEQTSVVPPMLSPSRPAGILVVDDEDLVRTFSVAVLEQQGYRVLTASDGPEAIKLYQQHVEEIDLVLLDYSMPGMTGLQVLETLLPLYPALTVIFSSGYTMDTDSDHLLASGAKAFLPKPYLPDDLRRIVREILGQPAPQV